MSAIRWRLPFAIPSVEDLAVPAVSGLVLFLAYTSQYLFYYIEPGPLSKDQAVWFNVFVFGIWWCYDRVCSVDPGPKGWVDRVTDRDDDSDEGDEVEGLDIKRRLRWCTKCDAVKPPRAHHCKQCGRCIPKMDHHCPWTTNCVSHTTFPHFIRFILYAVISMSILAYHLLVRLLVIWNNRKLPAYLGPSVFAMAHLFILVIVNSITLFALAILFTRAVYSLATNTTMIESWEIERHEALVDRARKTGGYVYANGGQKMRVERQEFPYDIGIWKNLCQGMGTRNVILWFLPFGGAPSISSAGDFEVNGFEDASKMWPPPDPEKMPRIVNRTDEDDIETYTSPAEEIAAFKRRQQKDYERWQSTDNAGEDSNSEYESEYEEGMDGNEGWTNSDGDRLRDYGVDEDTEMVAEDDIPLAELLIHRKAKRKNL